MVDVLCVTSVLLCRRTGSSSCTLTRDSKHSQDTCVAVGIYNRHGWVAKLENVFYPPEKTAYFHTFTYVPLSGLGQCSSIVQKMHRGR